MDNLCHTLDTIVLPASLFVVDAAVGLSATVEVFIRAPHGMTADENPSIETDRLSFSIATRM
jgi:hypothetical protein